MAMLVIIILTASVIISSPLSLHANASVPSTTTKSNNDKPDAEAPGASKCDKLSQNCDTITPGNNEMTPNGGHKSSTGIQNTVVQSDVAERTSLHQPSIKAVSGTNPGQNSNPIFGVNQLGNS